MKTTISLIACVLWGAWSASAAPPASAASDGPSQEELRATIERTLPYLEKAGVEWIESKACVSCHRISFLTWSLSEADRRGFEIDRQKLAGWVDWSVNKSLQPAEEGKPVDGALNLEGIGQLMLAHRAGSISPLPPKPHARFVQLLVKGQQKDGSWKAGGQLPNQKRSKDETTQVTTIWNAFVLGTVVDNPEAVGSRDRALAWLAPVTAGKSTEWYAFRLLLSHQQKDEARTQDLLKALRDQQSVDGGWGWLVGDRSDALGTGMAVYALSVAGVANDDPALRRAQQFLVSTQLPDGSWTVRGTKQGKKGRPEETASYWGAGWAAIALLQTLR